MADPAIVIWSDISCPFAYLAVELLHRTRHELDLEGDVQFDPRAFPLEIFNGRPEAKPWVDHEASVLRELDSRVRWVPWSAEAWEWPITSLSALEGVQAAREQDIAAGEELDLALRRAYFAESQCVSLRSVVLEVAERCELVDEHLLADAIDEGRARRTVTAQCRDAAAEHSPVRGSPHLFLPDGTHVHNPGIEMHVEGEGDERRLVIDDFDPSVYETLVKAAAGTS